MLLWMICWEHCQEGAVGAGLGEGSGAVASRFWSDRAGICSRALPSCSSVLRHCFLHMAVPESWAGASCHSWGLSLVEGTVVIRLAIAFLPLLPTSPPSLVLPVFLSFPGLPADVPFCRDTLHLCPFLSIPPHS